MTTDPTLAVLMTLLLVAHLATLHLLRGCGGLLGQMAGGFGTAEGELTEFMADSTRHFTELVAIGSDLADVLESALDGGSTGAPAPVSGPVDLPSTILSLITSRMMEGLDGGTTGQERAVHEQQADTPPVIDLNDDGSPTAF